MSSLTVAKTSIVDLFETSFTETYSESNRTITTSHDILVLSCALYRLKTTTPVNEYGTNIYSGMTLTALPKSFANEITDEDYTLAKKVTNHFVQKIVFAKLRGTPLTKFRQDMSEFLTGERIPTECPERLIGMAYKLPYFYEYDCSLYQIFGTEYRDIKVISRTHRDTKSLVFIQKLLSHRRRNTMIEYWFKDEHDNRVLVELEKHNPVISLWENALDKPIEIKAKYESKRKDSLEYYFATGWKVA